MIVIMGAAFTAAIAATITTAVTAGGLPQMGIIAHLGYMGGFDVITALSALEMSLSDLGYECPKGKSIKAAQTILKENWE